MHRRAPVRPVPWQEPAVHAELDRLTGELRDRVDAWEQQLRAVEREVFPHRQQKQETTT